MSLEYVHRCKTEESVKTMQVVYLEGLICIYNLERDMYADKSIDSVGTSLIFQARYMSVNLHVSSVLNKLFLVGNVSQGSTAM